MQILAGDIGGTNTRLALFQATPETSLRPLLEMTYSSQSYDSIETVLQLFLAQATVTTIEAACFGIAGPVINQVCQTTNLPWRISANQIQLQFNFKQTCLINDLEANAWGIEVLDEKDFFTLSPGADNATGNRSIISAGTGLGEAALYWDGERYHPFPSEGGHTDFSPSTPFEFELFQTLKEKYGHVSWEHLVSGPGLVTIYDYLLRYRNQQTPVWLNEVMEQFGKAPAISDAALESTDPLCRETLELFTRLYGREAGNHALKIMATGGVYLGGGIAPRIMPILREGSFMEAFTNKETMRRIMLSMPVKVILNDKTALFGAANYAKNLSCHSQ
ncbi:MAG: glucokinase [Candidatus Thiodiazotropha sp.]|jgi:glucokinase